MTMARCNVCFRQCEIQEGELGFCGARTCKDGIVIAGNYGILTALNLDPIEKKPLRNFHPGSKILSVGSYGCNLRCPFCQNNSISWSDDIMAQAKEIANRDKTHSKGVLPQALVREAKAMKRMGNIGIAFTYNEPLVGYEYVRDTARLAHEAGLLNVMVTNGTASLAVLEELAPYIDAMNIDLKGFTDEYYRNVLGGDRQMVMNFIEEAVKHCHVEITTLIIPGENDSDEEMRQLSRWIAGLQPKKESAHEDDSDQHSESELSPGAQIPLHISRFFPQFHMTDRGPTPVETIYHLADVARENLQNVYTGNC